MEYIIWLDSEKAQTFALTPTGIEKSHLKKSGVEHHTRDKNDKTTDSDLQHFYRDLAAKLSGAKKLLIMGPGLGKTHFNSYLESHHSGGLAKAVIGVENSDHPTDNQILASARGFFKVYDHFNTSVKEIY